MTEFEAERERLATLMEFANVIDEQVNSGKSSFTAEELQQLIRDYAKKVKIHK